MVKCSVFCYGYVVVRTIVLCNLYKNRKNIVAWVAGVVFLKIKYTKPKRGLLFLQDWDWVDTRS